MTPATIFGNIQESGRITHGGTVRMDEFKITVRDDGSLRVVGPVVLEDADGNQFKTRQSFSLCRCGASENKPFCDGTHKQIDFKSAPRAE